MKKKVVLELFQQIMFEIDRVKESLQKIAKESASKTESDNQKKTLVRQLKDAQGKIADLQEKNKELAEPRGSEARAMEVVEHNRGLWRKIEALQQQLEEAKITNMALNTHVTAYKNQIAELSKNNPERGGVRGSNGRFQKAV